MTEQVELECEGCGATFRGFLEEMAAKNEKVLCPNCIANCPPPGKVGKPQDSVH